MNWNVTTSLVTALAGGYIGEVVINQKKLQMEVSAIYGGPRIKTFTLFYYGTPDSELRERFGYGKAA